MSNKFDNAEDFDLTSPRPHRARPDSAASDDAGETIFKQPVTHTSLKVSFDEHLVRRETDASAAEAADGWAVDEDTHQAGNQRPQAETYLTANEAVTGRVNRRRVFEPEPDKTWWTTRRKVLIGGGAAATLALVGGSALLVTRDDTTDVDSDSLQLQQQQGWNIGSEDTNLNLPDATEVDSRGSSGWRDYTDPARLLAAYQPANAQWLPFFVPTLIQSLQAATLRTQLKPVFNPAMQEAYLRGQAVARDFLRNSQNTRETVLIVDLPGKLAVAFGAGLSDAAQLVTTFDNYPHPRGVTPSHETLGAMLYYANEIEAKQQSLTADAPVALLLDSNRLNEYLDADSEFDNRYVAKLPTPENLKERGVKSILYFTPDRTRTTELDDLNEEFVAYRNQDLNVAMLPLSDFTPSSEGAIIADGNSQPAATSSTHYYYGGSPLSHFLFFYYFPFYSPYGAFGARYNNYLSPGAQARTSASRPGIAPPRYTPVPRPTMFTGTRIGNASARGVGRTKPSGFGRATVRVTPSGRVVGTRAGRSGFYSRSSSVGRSGSFGRSSGGGSGG